MKKFCLFLISLILIPFLWTSCDKSEEVDDNEPPVISNVRFNFNDTIIWGSDNEIITINQNTAGPNNDTLVIGKLAYMTAHFKDNAYRGLSSYRVKFRLKMKRQSDGQIVDDSLFAIGATIFDSTEITIKKNNLITLSESMSRTIDKVSGIYDIQEGDCKINIAVGDRNNNVDSTSYEYTLKILSRESIYNIRKGN